MLLPGSLEKTSPEANLSHGFRRTSSSFILQTCDVYDIDYRKPKYEPTDKRSDTIARAKERPYILFITSDYLKGSLRKGPFWRHHLNYQSCTC